ncbi:MAG: hypothetical protein AAF647_01110 [Pseudomonadota bacterium]
MNGLIRTVAAVSFLAAAPAAAQEVHECDFRARADAIVEPWSLFSRTFANGAVRLALMDLVEPALGPLHIFVVSPPFDELGTRQCKIISVEGTFGFAGVLFEDMQASYDPATGLTFIMDVQVFDGFDARPRVLEFTLNQATGEITTRLF